MELTYVFSDCSFISTKKINSKINHDIIIQARITPSIRKDHHNIIMYLDHQYHDYVIICTDDQQVNFTSTNFLRENEHKKLNTSG